MPRAIKSPTLRGQAMVILMDQKILIIAIVVRLGIIDVDRWLSQQLNGHGLARLSAGL